MTRLVQYKQEMSCTKAIMNEKRVSLIRIHFYANVLYIYLLLEYFFTSNFIPLILMLSSIRFIFDWLKNTCVYYILSSWWSRMSFSCVIKVVKILLKICWSWFLFPKPRKGQVIITYLAWSPLLLEFVGIITLHFPDRIISLQYSGAGIHTASY